MPDLSPSLLVNYPSSTCRNTYNRVLAILSSGIDPKEIGLPRTGNRSGNVIDDSPGSAHRGPGPPPPARANTSARKLAPTRPFPFSRTYSNSVGRAAD